MLAVLVSKELKIKGFVVLLDYCNYASGVVWSCSCGNVSLYSFARLNFYYDFHDHIDNNE